MKLLPSENEALAVFRVAQVSHLASVDSAVCVVDGSESIEGSISRKGRAPHGRILRWLDVLAKYRFKIVYKKQSFNIAPHYLSRVIHGEEEQEGLYEVDLVFAIAGRMSAWDLMLKGLSPFFVIYKDIWRKVL